MTTTPTPGQIWADNDPRSEGRYLRIKTVDTTHVTAAQILRNGDGTFTDAPLAPGMRTTRIRLDRLRPTSSGYRLVQHADGTPAEGSSEQ
ncbi:hypothetical protein ACWERV_17160 [Streptomyces sp. NPDC004031]